MIREQRFPSWLKFQKFLRDYVRRPKARRDLLLFRGHSDVDWPLETTLDRHRKFASDAERDRYYDTLKQEFELEALRSRVHAEDLPSGDALDLLARHHRLPSPILDWSSSPYVASFFAFEGARPDSGTPDVAIWVFDQSRFDPVASQVEVIDSARLLRYNPRALKQQGVFTRVRSVSRSLPKSLEVALTKLIIPSSEREAALSELDAMSINAATLFGDLDAAARTAVYRVDS